MKKPSSDKSFESKAEELRQLYFGLREEMRRKWNRDLPIEDLLFDRWERAKALGFGEGTNIYHNSYVFQDVKVGRNTWIGPFTILDGRGVLEIGDGCNISAGVQIYTHDTVKRALTDGKADYACAPVKIGNFCYIGSGAIIAKGVTIGDYSVIGSSAFVNRDIPSYSVVVGVPCRVIGKVEIDKSGEVTLVYKSKRSRRLLARG